MVDKHIDPFSPPNEDLITMDRGSFTKVFKEELEEWAAWEDYEMRVKHDGNFLARCVFDRLLEEAHVSDRI